MNRTSTAIQLACGACGATPDDAEPWPFRCPRAGSDGADHLLERRLDAGIGAFPEDPDPHPFVRYRTLLHSYVRARAGGMRDEDFVALVRALDGEVIGVEGRGFEETPFARDAGLSDQLRLDGVWIKHETGNVGGSHKARHLFGLALHLEVAERLGLAAGGPASRTLAIASCGNAGLAAAVVARAARRSLEVFVPEDADPAVLEALRRHGARTEICARAPGELGDPCMRRFRARVAEGALPFCCQGSENGLTIEGGQTLAWEMVSRLRRAGRRLDRVFVQVGGGALASAVVQAFREARALGALETLPRIHPVQTAGAWPLRRAWDRLSLRLLRAAGREDIAGASPDRDELRAQAIRAVAGGAEWEGELRYAATHRDEFMWPWEETPRSVAHGILDDETYDWRAVVTGTLETGGFPVVVREDQLIEARTLARHAADGEVSATGAAGLAGLLALRERGLVGDEETVAVLFTGMRG